MMNRQDFRFFHPLRVRWAEVDMQKIVFNSHYLMYFDTAISDYWRALGLPYEEAMLHLGGDLYVKKASVEYHRSARFDDWLDVALRCSRVGRSSMTFDGACFRGRGGDELLVSCELIYVFADPATQKPQPVPQVLRDQLADFEAGGGRIDVVVGDWAALGEPTMRLRTSLLAAEPGLATELVSDRSDDAAVHALAYNGLRQAVACGRLVECGDGTGRIGCVAVHRALRNSGCGLQMMATLETAARQRALHEITLQAPRGAAGFFKRVGYVLQTIDAEEAGMPYAVFHKVL